MKKFGLLVMSFLMIPFLLKAQALSGEEILRRIDQNLMLDKAISKTTMIVHSRTGSRTIKSKSWVKGRNTVFVEYLFPAREKGKKMLRLEDKLWNYIPEPTDRIITISGHLLRQSVMGSDLSYEDMMRNDKLSEMYNATVIDSEEINGHDCYVVELTAKEKDVTYYTRKIWVAKKQWLPIKEELFAKSGKLLKRVEILDIFKIDDRWYPRKMTFKDVLSSGKGTEYTIESIDFKVDIPDYIFTKASLRK